MPASEAFGIYVHWPFCRSKCPYCDFNSHVRDSVDQARWHKALLAEIDHFAARTPGRVVSSIFFGGGTPSLMPPDTAAAVIARIGARWTLAPDIEITLEANPTSVEAANFVMLRQAGVNRVSLGVQSLDDAALKFLGRGHSASEARRAVALAQASFERFSFDLIYGRPGHSAQAWRAELSEALAMAVGHLSLYQLTIERGTRFFTDHARGLFTMPDEDAQAALYETTQEVLGAAGLPAYEISNHARLGQECRHNLVYWRYQDYVGIGPGAHGRLIENGRKIATRQISGPEAWLEQVEAQGHGGAERNEIAPEIAAQEALMMGLRLAEGIDAGRFAATTGITLSDAVDGVGLRRMIEGGFLRHDGARLVATTAGRQRLNGVLQALLA